MLILQFPTPFTAFTLTNYTKAASVLIVSSGMNFLQFLKTYGMKSLLVLIPAAALVLSCGTPRSTHPGSANPTTRAMKHGSGSGSSEEVTVTGTQYIPINGRNEAGIRADMEGTWVLQSGVAANNTNNITSGKTLPTNEGSKDFTGAAMSEGMKNSKEVKRDSTTTKTADGGTQTTTTVYLLNNENNQGNKITPPQSANPNIHVPEKPSLRFYGANETFSGFTGCNKISGMYTMKGNSISFHNAAASTKMACIGEYDENEFLSKLRRVNTFRSTSGQLELLEGDNVLLVFSKK
jgi:heat shock protein HslJ